MTTASAGTLNVVIRGVDQVSAPLLKIGGNVRALNAALGRLGNASGVTPAVRTLAAGLGAAVRNLAAMVPALGAVTAAGSVAGLYRLVGGFAAMGAELGRTAYRVQTTASALHVMGGAARLAGSSAEDLSAGLEGLGGAVIDAAGGRDDTAAMYLRMLRIDMRNAAGEARTASEVLPEVADGIARIADPRLQARVMGALRLPAGLLPYLRQGAAGMRAYEEEARRAGAVTEEGAAAARQFEMAQTRLSLAGQGLTNILAARLAPVLVPLLDRLSNWLIEKGPQLGDIVEGLARRFAAWVDDGGLTRLGERLEAIGGAFDTVIGWMGGMQNAAIVLGAVLTARLLSPLTSIALLAGRLGLSALGGAASLAGTAAGTSAAAALGGAAVVGGAGYGFVRMLERYRETGAGSPERQRERATLWRDRGAVYGGIPAEPGPAPTDLLGLIGRAEGTDRGRGYNETLGYGAFIGGDRDLTGMTLDEIDEMQGAMLRHPGNTLNSSAAGRYQITRSTLRDLRGALGLDGSERFDAAMQDRLATALAERRGLRQFQAGAISRDEFQSRLAREWASIPDPRTGQGAYAGQRRPGVDQRTVDGVLEAARAPAAAAAPQEVNVRVTLAGPGSAGATIRTETPGGGVRIERPALGATP
ncbi:hypothetical protein [Falsiroseomonas sp. CW058]|uniref:hypothetical protein n=1 Tax=Falsiroseomonas sp. CW058 TaxID=3388664 RepID=UPI003D31A49C